MVTYDTSHMYSGLSLQTFRLIDLCIAAVFITYNHFLHLVMVRII